MVRHFKAHVEAYMVMRRRLKMMVMLMLVLMATWSQVLLKTLPSCTGLLCRGSTWAGFYSPFVKLIVLNNNWQLNNNHNNKSDRRQHHCSVFCSLSYFLVWLTLWHCPSSAWIHTLGMIGGCCWSTMTPCSLRDLAAIRSSGSSLALALREES